MIRKELSPVNQQTYDVYVGNVPKNTKEISLKQLFMRYGEVKQVLCRWKEEFFGYAIVKFATKFDADKVLKEITEVTLNGHTMPVKTARRSDQNMPNVIENKPPPYPDVYKATVYNGSPFSHTDYGYFQPPLFREEPPVPSQPMMLDVCCTTVINATTFCASLVSRADEQMFVTNALNNMNVNHGLLERKPSPKRIYAALYSLDNSWYRCHVIQCSIPNKPGMCVVRYIDYGNEEVISYKSIIELPEALQNIPPLASKFVLSNLMCDTKATSKKSYLHQLVNKRMTLCAYFDRAINEYQVVKCSCNGKDVIQETINKGFAKLQSPPPIKREIQPPKQRPISHNDNIKLNKNDCTSQNHHDVHVLNKVPAQPSKKILTKPVKNMVPVLKASHNGILEDTNKDFHPKMIIKRGSEFGRANGTVSTTKQVEHPPKAFPNLIDTVITNLKLINNIRGLVSQSSDDSIIKSAVSLLKEEIPATDSADTNLQAITDHLSIYTESLDKLKACLDMNEISTLKSNRDSCRHSVCEKLKEYLDNCDESIYEKKNKIQKTITDLESNSNAWMNVQLQKVPKDINELVKEYNKIKDERWSMVSQTRDETNQKHSEFMDVFAAVQLEFYLNNSEECSSSVETLSISKVTSHSEKMNSALKYLSDALDKEIQTLTVNKDGKGVFVIQCLLNILDMHKDKIDSVCELHTKHQSLYQELTNIPVVEITLAEIMVAEKNVENLSQDLFAFLKENRVDECDSELSSKMNHLHQALSQADELKKSLCKASELYFPELLFEHPNLDLAKCSKHKCLLKNWSIEFFSNMGTGPSEKSFLSQFLHDPVIVKEYIFESQQVLQKFITRAVSWNETKSDHLIKIKAMFEKVGGVFYVMLPFIPTTLSQKNPVTSLSDGERMCRILRQVLTSLRDIHAAGMVHGALHLSTVLVDQDKAMLDFCFQQNSLEHKLISKGIDFCAPETKTDGTVHSSSDMYAYGCLVLTVLFPNLSFSPNENNVPNVAAFRSIVEELISTKDYLLLCQLMGAKSDERPSSATLVSQGFLSKYETYCRNKCDSQNKL